MSEARGQEAYAAASGSCHRRLLRRTKHFLLSRLGNSHSWSIADVWQFAKHTQKLRDVSVDLTCLGLLFDSRLI